MRNAIRLMLFVMIIILLFVQGCYAVNTNVFEPTTTPTFTQLVCPSFDINTSFVRPEELSYSKIVIILFDNSQVYESYTKEAFDTLNNVLVDAAQPGDKLFMVDMNSVSFDESVVVYSSIGDITAPLAPPTPTLFPTPTSTLPPYSTPVSSIAQTAENQYAQRTAVSVNSTATQLSFIYNCANQAWQEEFLSISQEWESQKEEAVTEFISDITEQQSNIISINNDKDSQVWEGLSYASLIMKSECRKFDRCILIIFSDMNESRSIKPDYLDVDLKNVEVIGAMLNCKFLFSPDCAKWIDAWSDYMFSNEINVKSVDFINGENLEQILFQILKFR
jgi:hypothetical protein